MFRKRLSLCHSVVCSLFIFQASHCQLAADEREPAWQVGWNEQKDLFIWPKSLLKGQLAQVKDLRFGDDVPDRDEIREHIPQRLHDEYMRLIESLTPLIPRDDWDLTIRMPKLKRGHSSEEVWLLLEDWWLQQEILKTLKRVNANAARFKQVAAKGTDDPKQRAFRNAIWEVELKIIEKDRQSVLMGSLKNITDRVQTLGINEIVKFQVWLSADAKTAIDLKVEGATVEAGKTLEVRHVLPADLLVREIARVEQVLDIRNVPVKRIEFFELGKTGERQQPPERGDRGGWVDLNKGSALQHANPLLMSKFSKALAEKKKVKESTVTANGIARNRYLKVTDQYRQAPFGIVVLIDQFQIKELLEEFGRSKLRIQIAQVEWSRFHAPLDFKLAPEGKGPANSADDLNGPGLLEMSIYGIATLFEPYPQDRQPPKVDPKLNSENGLNSNPWLQLCELINRSLPVPGPDGNLLEIEQKRLWDFTTPRHDGPTAVAKHFDRQRRGADTKTGFAQQMRDSLATVDIEAVHTRYVSDLKALFDRAAVYHKKYVGDDKFEPFRSGKLEGEGWVVEIRGTTWYNVETISARDFISRSVLTSLNKQAKDPKLPETLKGKISHAVLYNAWRDPEARPSQYHLIQASLLDYLIGSLITEPKIDVKKVEAAKPVDPKEKAKGPIRHEFVGFFVWKEPPPIDPLLVVPPHRSTHKWGAFFDPISPPSRAP